MFIDSAVSNHMAGVSQVLLANIQPLESQQVLLANIQPIYAANGEEILRTGIGTSPFKNSNFSDTLYVLKLLVNLTSVGNLLNIIFYLLLVLWVLCRIYKLEKWWARGIKQGRLFILTSDTINKKLPSNCFSSPSTSDIFFSK